MVATHMTPSQERKAGSLCVALGGPDEPAPAARAKKAGPRWCVLHDGKLTPSCPNSNLTLTLSRCVLENGELFVLPTASSAAAEVQLKLGLVGVRGVSCPSELQARPQHATHPSSLP